MTPAAAAPDPASPRLGIHLVHSTDEPERTVAAVRMLAAAAEAGARPVLLLDVEGVRLAARGVAETLRGDGRPDVKALLTGAIDRGARLAVLADAWRERGYLDDALLAGAALCDAAEPLRLVASGVAFLTY